MRRLRVFLIGLSALCGVFLAWQFVLLDSITPLMETDQERVAVWMGVTWSMDSHSDEDLRLLADDLANHHVTDAYVYVSYLKAGDFFNPTFDEAANFTSKMQIYAPDILWWAWVGVPIGIEQPDGIFIDNRLTNPTIREQIAEFATLTIEELGFDGFHLNAEPIPDGDVAFLKTLETIRAQLPDDAPLSSTAHALRLTQSLTSVPYVTMPSHWSQGYLEAVAQHTDQIALMAYDSGLPFPRDYREWMTYQVTEAAAALAGNDTELFIGLPTTEEWTPTHQTQAETFSVALRGFQNGYSTRIDGIALYAYWDTTADEWEQLSQLIGTAD